MLPDTTIFTCALGQSVALIVSGFIDEGTITDTIGSTPVVYGPAKIFPRTTKILFPVHYHAIMGMYFQIDSFSSAGLSFKWLLDNFFAHEIATTEKNDEDLYDVLII